MAGLDRSGLVWITGASSGLGRALALLMAKRGHRVAISARKAESLDEVVKEGEKLRGTLYAVPLDVTDEAQVRAAVEAMEKAHGEIALAILNAGTHIPLDVEDFNTEAFRKLIDVNVMGVVNCLAPIIERMRARKQGHIAVVASVAGYCGLPSASAYGLTKAGLINMCEALEPELALDGVQLQLVNPGFVRTPLTDKNDFNMPFLMEPDDAAAAFYDGLQSDRFEIVFPRRMACAMAGLRNLPYRLFFKITRSMARDRRNKRKGGASSTA